MPLGIKWSYYNKENVARESDNYGVYELGDGEGNIVYIGEGQVYSRLLCHFSTGTEPCPGSAHYRVEYTGGKDRAVQRQNAELKNYADQHGGNLPRYNTRSRN